MKKVLFLIFCVVLTTHLQAQHSFLTYYERSPVLQTSPDAFKFGLYGYQNPAVTSYLQGADMQFSYWNKDVNGNRPWGLFFGDQGSGFGLIRSGDASHYVVDYRYSVAILNADKIALGINYGFVGGDKAYFNRSNTLGWGVLIRPNQYLSIGGMQTYALDRHDIENVADIAVRPFGDKYPLAFFADASMFNNQSIDQALWGAGISWELVDGIRINSRYFSNQSFSVGLDVSFGNMGVSLNQLMDKNGNTGNGAASIRIGALDRTIFKDLTPQRNYMKLDLSGEIKYQRNILFDKSLTLYNTIQQIHKAKKDKSISGIVVNFTNTSANKELLWEIRKELEDFKSNGKSVIIFVDRLGIDGYEFASVADKIIMDDLGTISLEGYILGRSYYKKMLDNIHIGFDEIRLFKYKSAYENFARQTMSEADKEQRQALVDDWYNVVKKDIMTSRGISEDTFNNLVNGTFLYSAKEAKSNKLIDTTGRWLDCSKIISNYDNKIVLVDAKMVLGQPKPIDDKWGYTPKKIAIIYAIGECAMDAGIKARTLVKDLTWAINSSNISAIVLRVDSPGGDALASDYIAEVMRQNKGKKPIIVSQGAVAGSGGYWLSMYADTIVASPLTITGSIGVISSWIYDKGLKDSIGIGTDFVKVGKFADLGYSYQFPLIGIGLPTRDLYDNERKIIENYIDESYQAFTQKVSEGRKMPIEKVKEVAQGRIWSGVEGKEKQLVDVLGNLQDAINIACQKAGIKKDESYDVVELPKQNLFDLNLSFLNLFGVHTDLFNPNKDYLKEYLEESLKMRIANNGKAMFVVPIDYYDSVVWE